MRQIYKYQIIRYYPHSLSEEFINVGILLDGVICMDKIISEFEVNIIYCSALIGEKKKFLGVIKHLNKLSEKGLLRDNNHYFNNFRFTEKKQLASDKNAKDILEGLFYDYIGHKYPKKEKIAERERIIRHSYELVEKNFKNYIRIYQSNDFDFEIENIKNHIKHHSIVGSISNKQDVSKTIMATPAHPNKINKYDFLDISKKHLKQSEELKEKLDLNNIVFYSYLKDKDIANYLEKIV